MSELLNLVLQPENFIWAWKKTKRLYRSADGLFNPGEVAAFDLDLMDQLRRIRKRFEAGTYSLKPIRLLPQPKKPDQNGVPRVRQSFEISVADQVAWIAILNALGPKIDRAMPGWSYGHRLYRAAWYEENNDGQSILTVGPYRHANGQLYRNFKHSWPLFRRHIALTARVMGRGSIDPEQLDLGEQQALGQRDDIPYFSKDFWPKKEVNAEKIYAASIDLKHFYPSINTSAVLQGFISAIPELQSDDHMRRLISSMLKFQVSVEGLSDTVRATVEPPVSDGLFDGIPTGLMVGGFLANAAMLPVDREVDALVRKRQEFAHFRFVDDHVVLSPEFEIICSWIQEYSELLKTHRIGAQIAEDKFDPKELGDCINGKSDKAKIDQIKKQCEVDSRMPLQLMTRTLGQVSAIAAGDVETLSPSARAQRFEQLEWLLLANIPETEIRADTRAAFAAGQIARLSPSMFSPSVNLVDMFREVRRSDGKVQSSSGQDDLKEQLQDLLASDDERRRQQLERSFYLLWHAFAEHPDKVRLFCSILQFCRATGHPGLSSVEKWMEEHISGDRAFLKRYLSAVSLQILAHHLPSCASDLQNLSLLHSQRDAARRHLEDICTLNVDSFVQERGILEEAPEFFQLYALRCFRVGIRAAISILSADPSEYVLAAKLNELATMVGSPDWERGSSEWIRETDFPIGVWVHWAAGLTTPRAINPTVLWLTTREFQDPRIQLDWNNLRRFPHALPNTAWDALHTRAVSLKSDDAGWLLDATRAAPSAFDQLPRELPAAKQVTRVIETAPSEDQFISLLDWIGGLWAFDKQDPRAGEWTALEIVRQIIEPVTKALGTLASLENLHPAKIDVPSVWTTTTPLGVSGSWTWELWRSRVRAYPIKIRKVKFQDYRLSPSFGSSKDDDRWPSIMRSLGLLLWGMLRQDFNFPAAWNIRGQERDLIGFVGGTLERLRVSTETREILESCLLPRSRETVLMIRFRELLLAAESAPTDVAFDVPPIFSVNDLLLRIKDAQANLQRNQISLLSDEPRQMIPVSLTHMASTRLGPQSSNEDAPLE